MNPYIPAIILNIGITVFEIVFGLIIRSTALLSDALHNFLDIGSMGLSYFGDKISQKDGNNSKTYGYKRMEVLIGFINGAVLFGSVMLILFESIKRLFSPETVSGGSMMIVALVALFGNGLAAYFLHQDKSGKLTSKSAFLHSLQDALFSLGVVLASILIFLFHWYILDPLISIVLSILLLKETYSLIQETINILMESVPGNIDLSVLKSELLKISGIKSVDDLHVWQTGSENLLLTAHIIISSDYKTNRMDVLGKIKLFLQSEYKIKHTTIQLITADEEKRLNLDCIHCN